MTDRPGHPLDRRAFLTRGAQVAGAAALAGTVGQVGLQAAGLLGFPEFDLSGAIPAASVPIPGIITRAQWGADESLRRAEPSFAPVTKVIVHHTVTANEEPDPRQRIRSIYRYHTQTRGWNDIGYNFLIDPEGRIYEGRFARAYGRGEVHIGESTDGQGVVGAHAENHNAGSVGIALLGTFNTVQPTAAAAESLVKLVSSIVARHGIDPLDRSAFRNALGQVEVFPNVAGHRDVKSTACPGGSFYGELGGLRRQAALTVANGLIGYRILAADGRMAHLGGARNYGDPAGIRVGTRMAGGAGVPNSQGYWVTDRHGSVFSFGGAGFYGSLPGLRKAGKSVGDVPVLGMVSTPSGHGYWLYDEAGGIFGFGDAHFFGSVPGLRRKGLRVGPARIAAMAATATGQGYWVADEAGGIFTFGDARFFGSVPQLRARNARIGRVRVVSMAAMPSGDGYWLVDENGGVFSFGHAPFRGSLPGIRISDPPVRRIVAAPTGRGYLMVAASGAVYGFGAPFYGRWALASRNAVDLLPVVRQ